VAGRHATQGVHATHRFLCRGDHGLGSDLAPVVGHQRRVVHKEHGDAGTPPLAAEGHLIVVLSRPPSPGGLALSEVIQATFRGVTFADNSASLDASAAMVYTCRDITFEECHFGAQRGPLTAFTLFEAFVRARLTACSGRPLEAASSAEGGGEREGGRGLWLSGYKQKWQRSSEEWGT